MVADCRVVLAAHQLGVETLTLYAFSAQNWARPRAEVAHLMQLLARFALEERTQLLARRIRLLTIGDLGRLPAPARLALRALELASATNRSMTLCLALSYGGREALTAAARALVTDAAAGRLRPEQVTEERLGAALSPMDLPPLDLVIRTSGEQRLSNFMLWEAAFAELYFTPVLWPDFDRTDLEAALASYAERHRRFGRTEAQVGGLRACSSP